MSFDLYVWHESAPISADAAESKVRRWTVDGEAVFVPHPATAALREELLRRLPIEEDFWSVLPAASDSVLALSFAWSRAGEAGDAVRELASRHGLICYEPQNHLLNPNAPSRGTGFTLTSAAAAAVPDPDEEQLDRVTRRLGNDNYFATLERSDGHFVQVGYGVSAGAAPGVYALEHRAGRDGEHLRTETPDIDEAVRFIQEFRAGQDTWRGRHTWRSLSL